MKTSIVDFREEILAGISEMINDPEDYHFDFDGGNTANYTLYKYTDTENLFISITLDVGVAIHSTLGLLVTHTDLQELIIRDDDSEPVYFEITDKEIEAILNL